MLVSSLHQRNQRWFATVIWELISPLKPHSFRGRTVYALDMGKVDYSPAVHLHSASMVPDFSPVAVLTR